MFQTGRLLETWSRVTTKVPCADKASSTEITHDLPGASATRRKAAKERPEPRDPNFGREIVPGLRVLQRHHDERSAPEPRVFWEDDVLNAQARDLRYAQQAGEREEERERFADLTTREQFRGDEE